MTSSLRNSLHRRNHKERSQLTHRSRYGILEKHKDYVLRARDYHSKQDRLKRLKQKAADRNKDEFYFSMNKEQTQGGVHVKDRGNTSLPTDIVKVLKTQDENYIRTMRLAGLKKIDKIKGQLMGMADLLKSEGLPTSEAADDNDLDEDELKVLQEAGVISPRSAGKRRKVGHVVFVDSKDKAQEYIKEMRAPSSSAMDMTADSQEDSYDLGWKIPETKKEKKKRRKSGPVSTADEEIFDVEVEEKAPQAPLDRKRLLKELSARLFRDQQLRYASRELEMQRLMIGKGGRRKLRGVEKVENEDAESEEDEDALDARGGRPARVKQKPVDEKTWKPRIYKWRLERKK